MTIPAPPDPDDLDNPYAAPAGKIGADAIELEGDAADAQALRRRYGRHEASIRAMGLLSMLGAGVLALVAVILLLVAAGTIPLPGPNAGGVPPEMARVVGGVGAVFVLAFSALGFAVGIGLRQLQAWARWTQTVLLVIGVGTTVLSMLLELATAGPQDTPAAGIFQGIPTLLVNIYFLSYLLASESAIVFSRPYRAAVARTPELRFAPAILMQVLVALTILGLVIGGGGFAFLLLLGMSR